MLFFILIFWVPFLIYYINWLIKKKPYKKLLKP